MEEDIRENHIIYEYKNESEDINKKDVTTDSLKENKNEISNLDTEIDKYFFTVLNSMAIYKNIYTKDNMKLLEKWGLTKMELTLFRFNIALNNILIDKFIRDFFNDNQVKISCPGLSNSILFSKSDNVDKVTYDELTLNSTNLDPLDVVYDKKLVNRETGYIKKDFEETYEEIALTDKLKSALVNPECEYYDTFNDLLRKEFIFRIFQHISIGGSLNQFEDYAGEYFNMTKSFYKDLVSAYKENGKIKIRTRVFHIKKLNDKSLFKNEFNPQNFLYLIIDPYQKTIAVWYNKWENFW